MDKLKGKTLRTVMGVVFFAILSILSYTVSWNHPTKAPTRIRTELPTFTASSGALSLIIQPDQGTTPLLKLINESKTSIDMVMYQFTDKDVSEALVAKAKQGVQVRVLLNKGYYGKQEDDTNVLAYEYFKKAGIPVHWTPATFALTHQKTFIFDQQKALIMTWNLVPKYYPTGRDFGVLDQDPADVKAIEDTFNADWENTPIETQYGNDLIWSPNSESDMLLAIHNAKHTIEIYNELMKSDTVTQALKDAEARGVQVRIVMTYATSNKPVYNDLTHSGAEIHTFASSKKNLYIHAKMIVADDQIAFVGSENFSFTSLNKNRELGIFIKDPQIIQKLEETFEKDWKNSRIYVPK